MDNFRQRLCFSAPTTSDVLLDYDRKNEFQDLMMFFGRDETRNVIMLCIDQMYSIKKSTSLIYIKNHTGLESINKEIFNGTNEYSCWKTPSLQFQCVVPMQTWRIVFSGRLRNNGNHHVKINFLWKPFGFPVYCDKNNTFSKNEINDVDSDVINRLLGFDQFGQISGTMVIDDKTEMINMRAIKLRRWNMSTDDSVLAGFTDNGICSIQKLERINCSGHLKTILEHEMITTNEIHFSNKRDCNPSILIQHKNFSLSASLKSKTPSIMLNSVSCQTIVGDGFNGLLLCFKDVPKYDVKVQYKQITENNHVNLTVNLDSELCAYGDLVGNKAKSLFQLKKAIFEGLIHDAIVPEGICITTIAMKNHINENKDLSNSLNEVIQTAKRSDFEQLSDSCKRLINQWLSSKISIELMEAISNYIHERGIYAIRSSGTFEDGESTSSAGQYVTKLGCAGHRDDIAVAVLECWSSNFSAQALTYRKNNGQPLMCNMAVIIQDLVNTDKGVAGVTFTRDPNTGDPDKITVAANYGSGEGVVSGSVEPVAEVISRLQLKLLVADDDSTTKLTPPIPRKRSDFRVETNSSITKPSIPNDLLKKLADICIQVETVFGSAQDIEWAVIEDRVYLLQSRPITSIFAWSNDEITREFDSPLTSDDVVMFYNVKEVYPHPMHPLSLTLDFFSSNPLFKLNEGETTDMYRNKQLFFSHYNLCLNVCQMFQDLEPDSVFVKIIEYSIAGKCFLTSDIWEKILMKNRSSTLKKLMKSISTFKETLFLESRLIETRRLINNVKVEQSNSALDFLNELKDMINVLEKATICHVTTSSNNIVSHTLLAILGYNFNKDSTTESLSNLTASVNTPDITNVLILKDIQAIAGVISEMPSKREFCDLPVENCYDWLKLNCEKGFGQVEKFIEKYGHRGVQELDFGSETWSTDPNRLFSCLQSLIFSDHQQCPVKLIEDRSNTVSLGYFKKMIFDYLLTRYQKSISYREQSKDLLVQITHKLRMNYRKLGEKLVEEGRIPDSKLIFFMSQYEASKICSSYCPEIIHKASKRRKLWPTLSSLQFDDVCRGPPVPTDLTYEEFIDSSTRLKGCCVFPGRVKNRACVLEHIEDARRLQSGDILIVKSVDIAWSPYFPIISGLVTEIGGLISHGAVVAREYGLPCLVGVQNAKKHFKTGDTLILDSEKGFVIKDNSVN